MRIQADENVPPIVVAWLRGLDHYVFAVLESARSEADTDLLALADASQRVVITYDNDFGKLACRNRMPHGGIVLLRFDNAAAADHPALFQRYWPVIEARCVGAFVVLQDDDVRIRPIRDHGST